MGSFKSTKRAGVVLGGTSSNRYTSFEVIKLHDASSSINQFENWSYFFSLVHAKQFGQVFIRVAECRWPGEKLPVWQASDKLNRIGVRRISKLLFCSNSADNIVGNGPGKTRVLELKAKAVQPTNHNSQNHTLIGLFFGFCLWLQQSSFY